MSGGTGIVKRSVAIAGHRTSISLEEAFWAELQAIARERGRSVQSLVAEIDSGRGGRNLSSAIRVFVLAAVCGRITPASSPVAAPDGPDGGTARSAPEPRH